MGFVFNIVVIDDVVTVKFLIFNDVRNSSLR